jgi:hypothetical protein
MKEKILTAMLAAAILVVDVSSADNRLTAKESLAATAEERLIACAENLRQSVNDRSLLDSISAVFGGEAYPDVCVETVSSWYRKQIVELASSQENLRDQDFRSNLEALIEQDIETFDARYRQGSALTKNVSTPSGPQSTVEGTESSQGQLDAVRGYTNVTVER